MSRAAPRLSFPAEYHLKAWEGIPGVINIYDDFTFNWRPQVAAREVPPGELPRGSLADIENTVPSKAVENKPSYLRVLMRDKTSYVFMFQSTLTRQDAREALLAKNPANAAVASTSAGAASRPSTSPSPTNTPATSPVASTSMNAGPRVSIGGHKSPVMFNPPSQPGAAAATTATTKLSPAEQRRQQEEKEVRLAVLSNDPELKRRHMELVGNKLLSEHDFWIGKEARLEEERLLLRQKQGLVPESLIDPMRSDVAQLAGATTKEVAMPITAEMCQRVFLEHPEVKKKYKELVPHKISERQFWTAYLHCKYVLGAKRTIALGDVGKKSAGSVKKTSATIQMEQKAEELFGNVDEYRLEYREQVESSLKQQLSHVDPLVDLKTTLDDSLTVPAIMGLARDSGYGLVHRDITDIVVAKSEKEVARSLRARNHIVDTDVAKRINKAVRDDPVLTKINQRGTLAMHLEAILDEEVNNQSEEGGGELSKRRRMVENSNSSELLRRERLAEDHRAELELDKDLASPAESQVVKLELASSTMSETNPPAPKSSSSVATHAGPSASRAIERPVNPASGLPTQQHFYTVTVMSEEEARLAKLNPTLSDLPANIREAYLVAIAAVDEYCRHFWSASSETEANKKKRCLIVTKMREVQKQIDQDLRLAMRQTASDALPLLRLPLAQLGCCFEEHDAKCSLSHEPVT